MSAYVPDQSCREYQRGDVAKPARRPRLRSCPFCGARGRRLHFLRSSTEWYGDNVPIVECCECGACGPYRPPGDAPVNASHEDAAARWNAAPRARP